MPRAGLRRCERLLKNACAHVRTPAAGGFTLVKGGGPGGLPVAVTYPGPGQAVRHEITSRICAW